MVILNIYKNNKLYKPNRFRIDGTINCAKNIAVIRDSSIIKEALKNNLLNTFIKGASGYTFGSNGKDFIPKRFINNINEENINIVSLIV